MSRCPVIFYFISSIFIQPRRLANEFPFHGPSVNAGCKMVSYRQIILNKWHKICHKSEWTINRNEFSSIFCLHLRYLLSESEHHHLLVLTPPQPFHCYHLEALQVNSAIIFTKTQTLKSLSGSQTSIEKYIPFILMHYTEGDIVSAHLLPPFCTSTAYLDKPFMLQQCYFLSFSRTKNKPSALVSCYLSAFLPSYCYSLV